VNLSRRALVVGAVVAAFDCSRREGGSAGSPAASSTPARSEPSVTGDAGPGGPADGSRLLEWSFAGNERAVAVVPTWGSPGGHFPTVVALHGRGEALKSPADGAMGWPRDYELVRAMRRLRAPPLAKADFEGLIDDPGLAAVNAELLTRPFRGIVALCPYLPDIDIHSPSRQAALEAYGRFVIEVLLARGRNETPALAAAASTGIDGVSLGGAVALHVGLSNPLAFGAVGAIQPAIRVEDAAFWAERALAARRQNPALQLRLLTSEDDHFREAVTRTSQSWRAAGITHDFKIAAGPHDYVFNRGPGSIELLRWHDAVLQRA